MNLFIFSNWSLCPSLVLPFHLLKMTDFSQSRDKQHPKCVCRLRLLQIKCLVYFCTSYYNWGLLLLHLRPTVITYGASYYTWGQLLHLRPQQLLTDGQTDGITDLRTVPTKYKGFCARLRPRGKRRSLQGQQESAKKNGPRIFSR